MGIFGFNRRRKERQLFDVMNSAGNARTPVVAPLSYKGGVSKTTTARILAQSAANYIAPYREDDRKVLLIDLDPQCNTSMHWLAMETLYGSRFSRRIPPVHPALADSASGSDRFADRSSVCDVFVREIAPMPYETDIPGLHIVPNNEAEIDTISSKPSILNTSGEGRGSMERAVDLFSKWLRSDEIKKDYFLVVIDTPPRQDNVTALALAGTTHVYVPFHPSPQSKDGVHSIVHAIQNEATIRHYNDPLAFLGIYPTLVQNRNTLDQAIKQMVQEDPEIGSFIMPFQLSQRAMFSDRDRNTKTRGDVFRSASPSAPGYQEALVFVDAVASAIGLTKPKYIKDFT